VVLGTVRYKNVLSLFFFSHHLHATIPKTTGSQRQDCYRWYCSPLLLFSPVVDVDAAAAARMTPARQRLLMWLVLLSIRTGKRTLSFSQWFTLTTHTHGAPIRALSVSIPVFWPRSLTVVLIWAVLLTGCVVDRLCCWQPERSLV